ncbi:MAG: histidine kinase dimerization/phospho-acceptor domain-containing protein [Candidatus Omnitrophica bacterium]|nr:histidine kinase dimerization/phospho-acceptor domain-containing protein [Candidatus Omnitrophota bacterium]
MSIKEIAIKRRREFNNSICLTGVIPLLVFVYLLVNRVSSFNIFTGDVGYIMLATIGVFLTGIITGRRMLFSMLERISEYNREIITMQKELIEKNRLAAITETALALGHEINNPLLTVRGNLHLLKNEVIENRLSSPGAIDRITLLDDNCERIRRVMDKISNLSKPVSSRIEAEIKMIDLNESG